MRAKLIFSLLTLATTGLLALPVAAQEDAQSNAEIQELNSHQELNLNEDKTLIMDADAKSPKTSQATRDSSPAQINVKKQETQQKPSSSSADKADDPLSFNFLYFIIQKFKISDIVDN